MAVDVGRFREIVSVDFEFSAPSGERPDPVCMVAWELNSGRRIRLFREELKSLRTAPFAVGEDVLFVSYFASAELGCFLVLGWPLPDNVLDLYVEFRNHTNGLALPCGAGLIGALTYFGLDALPSAEKETMRQLAMRGGDYTEDEQAALLEYCETDVAALAALLPRMEAYIDTERALLRGRYMKAVARIENLGVPVDVGALAQLRRYWSAIQDRLIVRIDAQFGVYEGRTFKADRFARFLKESGIPWPRLESGHLDLSDDAFREMTRAFPVLAPLRELRGALSQMRLEELAVGRDGRNRTLLSPFRSTSGRNQPSNTKSIFGPAVWQRRLIQPRPGHGIVHADYCQQEFGIGAALSGDSAMMAAYTSGDPYLEFAKQAGAVPKDATKQTHPATREQFKTCALGVQYSMGPESLATKIGQSVARGRELIDLHRRTFSQFWRWADAAVDHAMLYGYLYTVFGWTVHSGPQTNPRSLRNFPMQANGAEMLRLACCIATERGIAVCVPIHDALLIEAPLEDFEAAVSITQSLMEEASAIVLGGFKLRSEAKVFRYPDRYLDERGLAMWNAVWSCIDELRAEEAALRAGDCPVALSGGSL